MGAACPPLATATRAFCKARPDHLRLTHRFPLARPLLCIHSLHTHSLHAHAQLITTPTTAHHFSQARTLVPFCVSHPHPTPHFFPRRARGITSSSFYCSTVCSTVYALFPACDAMPQHVNNCCIASVGSTASWKPAAATPPLQAGPCMNIHRATPPRRPPQTSLQAVAPPHHDRGGAGPQKPGQTRRAHPQHRPAHARPSPLAKVL